MRKKAYRYTKDDYVFVYQMLVFRSKGWSYPKIGEMFNKHHTTVLHWCKRFNVNVGQPVPTEDELIYFLQGKKLPNRYKYHNLLNEHINRGKLTYADYKREADLRKFAKRIHY
jgi:hypothetical protein